MTGVFETLQPIDNSIIFAFEAFNLAGGQYKKLFGRTLGPICEVLYEKHLESTAKNFLSKTNVSFPYGTCPIPKCL